MSSDSVSPEPELNAIEAALGSLVPARSQINRDMLMFQAGQASVRASRSGQRGWIAIAASLALVALGEAALLARRPPPQIVEKLVLVRAPAPARVDPISERNLARATELAADEDLLSLGQTPRQRLAGQVLRYGLDGLPAAPTVASPSSQSWLGSSDRLLKEEFRKYLEIGDPS